MGNKTNNNLITYEGITLNLTQWSELMGIKKSTLRNRIYTLGWEMGRALQFNWKTIGPLIEKYKIEVRPVKNRDGTYTWYAGVYPEEDEVSGPTPLIAACRAIVAKEE